MTNNNIDQATEAKHKLEQRQREEAKQRKEKGETWKTKVRSTIPNIQVSRLCCLHTISTIAQCILHWKAFQSIPVVLCEKKSVSQLLDKGNFSHRASSNISRKATSLLSHLHTKTAVRGTDCVRNTADSVATAFCSSPQHFHEVGEHWVYEKPLMKRLEQLQVPRAAAEQPSLGDPAAVLS